MTWKLTDLSMCQLRGVSREAEIRYHRDGIFGVEMLMRHLTLHGPMALRKRVERQMAIFRQARELELTDVIVNMFPVGTRTRVVSDRIEKALFFDIETDGAGRQAAVTLIAAHMNGVERVFVRGIDLPEFLSLWRKAEVIVSFNGKRFDVPVLMHEFGVTRIPAHVDLMDEGRHYGLKGGLKSVEAKIGFRREVSECRTGYDAVRLWHEYKEGGDASSLMAVKMYNLNDVRSLVSLYRYLLALSTEGL